MGSLTEKFDGKWGAMPTKPHVLSMGEMMPMAEQALLPLFRGAFDPPAPVSRTSWRATVRGSAPSPRGGRERVDASLIRCLPLLETIVSFAVGYDSIDLEAARQRGIIVTNTPDVLNDEVADYTVGLLLATLRRIPRAIASCAPDNGPGAISIDGIAARPDDRVRGHGTHRRRHGAPIEGVRRAHGLFLPHPAPRSRDLTTTQASRVWPLRSMC